MHVDDVCDYWTLWREFERRRRRREPEWTRRLVAEREAAAPISGDLVRDYLDAATANAERALREVENEVYVRRKLHDQAIRQLDYQITEAASSLESFRGWGVGYNRGVDQKRLSLERRLDSLRHEKRESRVRFWDDLVRMRKELHEKRKERDAAARRSRLR